MKKLLLLVYIITGSTIIAQCPTENVRLTTQAEVDNFIIQYPNCSELSVDLRISGAQIDNLNGLSGIEVINGKFSAAVKTFQGLNSLRLINGDFLISGGDYKNLIGLETLNSIEGKFDLTIDTQTRSVEGLSNLTQIGGDLSITGSFNDLENLSGLSSLETIGGSLRITRLENISDLTGFSSLNSIGGFLIISYNKDLLTLEGFSSFPNIGANIQIENNESLLSLKGFEELNNFDGTLFIRNNQALVNLEGLSGLSNFTGGFFISENDNLTSLSGLTSTIRIGGSLYLEGNRLLKNLSGLEGIISIGSISVRNTFLENFEGLDNLEEIDSGSFWIWRNEELTSLQGLNLLESINGNLSLNNNPALTNVEGLNGLTNISESLILDNHINLQSLSPLSSLTAIGGDLTILNCDALSSLEGLESMASSINGRLRLSGNDSLSDIIAISDLDPNKITWLSITGNSRLSICELPNICRYLDKNGENRIENNDVGCNAATEVMDACDFANNSNNRIFGTVFLSDDGNCTNQSFPIPLVKITSTKGENTYTTFTNTFGDYRLFLDEGEYFTNVDLNTIFSISPRDHQTTFQGYDNEDEIVFCINSDMDAIDLNVVVIPLSEPRPGFNSSYKIIYQNLGLAIVNGRVNLEFDNEKLEFIDSFPIEDMISDGLLTWDFSDLQPFESRIIDLNFQINAPPITNIDDVLEFTASISPANNDITPNDNIFNLHQMVIGSYDPNDKTVLEGDSIFIEEVDEFLHYVIRFQNTGTASAINVRVTDTLDQNLDWDTFTPIALSHLGNIQISNGQNVEFIFDNINLPDSITDEEGSNGFIAFKIKPRQGISVGDIMLGKAEIYFDFNPPIITNTVSTTVEEVLSTDEFLKENKLFLVPNPTTDILYFKSNNIDITKVEIYNSLGQKIKFLSNPNGIKKIDFTGMRSGLYFCEIESRIGEKYVKKVIKKN